MRRINLHFTYLLIYLMVQTWENLPRVFEHADKQNFVVIT